MDRCTNKRYKKLKVKRKQIPSKIVMNRTKLINDIHNDNDDDNENFKIKRFMKDVKQFCSHSPAEEYEEYRTHGEVFKTYKDKGDRVKDIGFNIKKDILKGNINDKNFRRRDGLFQRGVMTKGFNKGLMPPSLSARLNEDLKKVIELANRGSFKKVPDKMTNENVAASFKQFDLESCDSHCTKEIVSPNLNIDETRVQVEPYEGINNQRTNSDHYLQFTHFVTKCLFNSGIDKQEMKSYSDSIKDSLIQMYRNRRTENNSFENLTVSSPNDFGGNFTQHAMNTPRNCSPLRKAMKTSYSYLSTSKSEGDLQEKKFAFVDSQLSDDVVIRKPVNKLYASGLDYLKAVYSGNSESNRTYLSNATFSSSSQARRDPVFTSSNAEVYYSNSLHGSHTVNRLEYSSRYLSSGINSYNKENINRYHNRFSYDPSSSLQYFPGNNNRFNSYLWKNDNRMTFSNRNSAFKMETYQERPQIEQSPKYISLLPSNHRLYNNVMTNSTMQSVSYSGNLNDSVGSTSRSIHPLLSLPVHLPPRKSPDIQYIPRKMF